MPWNLVQPVCDYKLIRSLCPRPYPNHPCGCPNWGKRVTCPPAAPLLNTALNLSQDVWAVWNAYPLGEHMAKMQARHPKWTDRQLRNPLYWQGTARKQLKDELVRFLREGGWWPGRRVITCPEACGCNLTATMARIGVELDWPPMETAYQILLVGSSPPVYEAAGSTTADSLFKEN